MDTRCTQMDRVGVRLLVGAVQSLFDIVHNVCGKRQVKLMDLQTSNIGIDENNRLLLLDVETASVVPGNVTEGGWDLGQKARASAGVKSFFASLIAAAQGPEADGPWQQCMSLVVSHIFTR